MLPSKINSAPGHFQRQMSQILAGQNGTICHMDDMLIFDRTQQEHDRICIHPRVRSKKLASHQTPTSLSSTSPKSTFCGMSSTDTESLPIPGKSMLSFPLTSHTHDWAMLPIHGYGESAGEILCKDSRIVPIPPRAHWQQASLAMGTSPRQCFWSHQGRVGTPYDIGALWSGCTDQDHCQCVRIQSWSCPSPMTGWSLDACIL